MTALDLPTDILQWIFSPADLYRTPSAYDNWSFDNERLERAKGIEFLFRVGLSLGMNTHVLAAAAVYFHRFYMRYSFTDYHRFEIAATCLFLAGKVEESGRKLKDVASTCVMKLHRNNPDAPKNYPKEVEMFEQNIIVYELVLLEGLCFDLEIDHIHGHLVLALEEIYVSEEVAELSWAVANDTLFMPVCLLQPPNVIACACFLLGMQIYARGDRTLDSQLVEEFSSQGKEVFRISDRDMPGLRDTLAMIIEFWTSMDEASRAGFNTKLEDIRSFASAITPPSDSRTLSSYAPTSPLHHNTGPYANGTNGSSTPWQHLGTPNGFTPNSGNSGTAHTDLSGGDGITPRDTTANDAAAYEEGEVVRASKSEIEAPPVQAVLLDAPHVVVNP